MLIFVPGKNRPLLLAKGVVSFDTYNVYNACVILYAHQIYSHLKRKKWTEQSVLDQTIDNWEQNSKIFPEGPIRIKSTFVPMMSRCQTGRSLSYHLTNYGLLIDWCASTGLIEFSPIYKKIPERNIWWYTICAKCHFHLSRKDRIYSWLINSRILQQEHIFDLRSPFVKLHVIHEHYYLISPYGRLFGTKPLSKLMLSYCQLDP